MAENLYFNLRDVIGRIVFHGARTMERLFPPPILRCVFFPIAMALALRDLSRRRWLEIPFCKLPPNWSVNRTLPLLFNIRSQFHLTRLMANWPDRFSEPHWCSRFKIEGMEFLEQAMREKRPVILVSAHFGPLFLLRYFLRAMGWPAATFIGGPASSRPDVRRDKDRLAHFPGLPHVFGPDQSLRDVHRFLQQGNILLMAFDVPTGERIEVACDEVKVRFATGSIRLAASTNARLIPCIISECDPWKFIIRLGQPVPSAMLSPCPDREGAARHIAKECFQSIKASPAECGHELLDALLLRSHVLDSVAP